MDMHHQRRLTANKYKVVKMAHDEGIIALEDIDYQAIDLYLEGKELAEIADVLGITVGALSGRYAKIAFVSSVIVRRVEQIYPST